MQLHVHIKTEKPVTLPINYNHILQGVIYNAVADNYPNYADDLHSKCAQYKQRSFKGFTYGPLIGHFKTDKTNKTITFDDRISWEIRSCDPVLITILRSHFEHHGIRLKSYYFSHPEVYIENKIVNENRIRINAVSPIIAYSTLEENYTYYYSPEERGFYELTRLNAYKRFDAINKAAPGDIEFRPLRVSRKDKVITRYKGIIICGWKGVYELEGDPVLIDFLYQTGLGAKNAQGFGMFDVIQPQG